MSKKILILSTHPDDEVISLGGLLALSKLKGDHVHVHYFCVGGPSSNADFITRYTEISNVSNYLGFSNSYNCDLDGKLDTVPSCQLTKIIDDLVEEYKPDELYCSPLSEHKDHKALYDAFLGACRLKECFMPKLIAVGTYMFSDQLYQSPPGGKIFQPLTDEQFEMKCEAFKLYKSQLRKSPSPLGIDGLRIMAEYYGMLCGSKYAEMYYQLRYIRNIK